MTGGQLPNCRQRQYPGRSQVPFGGNTASRITMNYPFQFMVLEPGRAARRGQLPTIGQRRLTMQSSALMRNES